MRGSKNMGQALNGLGTIGQGPGLRCPDCGPRRLWLPILLCAGPVIGPPGWPAACFAPARRVPGWAPHMIAGVRVERLRSLLAGPADGMVHHSLLQPCSLLRQTLLLLRQVSQFGLQQRVCTYETAIRDVDQITGTSKIGIWYRGPKVRTLWHSSVALSSSA